MNGKIEKYFKTAIFIDYSKGPVKGHLMVITIEGVVLSFINDGQLAK